MSAPPTALPGAASPLKLARQPALMTLPLSLTALFWAGNAIVGRLAAGHIAPVTLSFLRWSMAFFIILPFAWKHLKQDWEAIRARLGIHGHVLYHRGSPLSTPCNTGRSSTPRR